MNEARLRSVKKEEVDGGVTCEQTHSKETFLGRKVPSKLMQDFGSMM